MCCDPVRGGAGLASEMPLNSLRMSPQARPVTAVLFWEVTGSANIGSTQQALIRHLLCSGHL